MKMKRYAVAFLACVLVSNAFAQLKNAKEILDKTTETFQTSGGVKAEFNIRISDKSKQEGFTTGTILLDGDKFKLETREATTWFDGETQWSYMAGSDEINISNPTEEELQSINPYALLSLYKENYTLKTGNKTSFEGKNIYEVNLFTKDKKKEITHLTLYIAKHTYQPLFILAELRDQSKNEITIKDYKTGVKHDKQAFVFNPKDYPDAEIIDLR